ncbi:MAG: hypothetical protein IPH31_23390 [Lewinellaceae bacterium]|nr:hypothetical protein [Lewinellaceae bacterium]
MMYIRTLPIPSGLRDSYGLTPAHGEIINVSNSPVTIRWVRTEVYLTDNITALLVMWPVRHLLVRE